MGLSELVAIINGFAEIAVTLLLAYAAYKIAVLVDTINHKIGEERKPS